MKILIERKLSGYDADHSIGPSHTSNQAYHRPISRAPPTILWPGLLLQVSKTVAKRLEKEGSALEKEVNALKAQLAKEEDGNVELKTKIENLQDEVCVGL